MWPNRPFAKKKFIFFLESTIKNKLKSKRTKEIENKRKEAFYGGYAKFQIFI